MPSRFVFVTVQSGAERALKNEIAREHPELKFAFSRPGFVTFRSSADLADDFVLRTVFARTWGFSLGKVNGSDDSQRARDAWRLFGEQLPDEPIRDLHVWQRDRVLPGRARATTTAPPTNSRARSARCSSRIDRLPASLAS